MFRQTSSRSSFSPQQTQAQSVAFQTTIAESRAQSIVFQTVMAESRAQSIVFQTTMAEARAQSAGFQTTIAEAHAQIVTFQKAVEAAEAILSKTLTNKELELLTEQKTELIQIMSDYINQRKTRVDTVNRLKILSTKIA